jgi:hypothetical protein
MHTAIARGIPASQIKKKVTKVYEKTKSVVKKLTLVNVK